ncbi:MAG: hypothetical protein IE931_07325 [Sphingobacteriales bacterium]|nr:hypothetical protein [Sphingobacteriales bacterium]
MKLNHFSNFKKYPKIILSLLVLAISLFSVAQAQTEITWEKGNTKTSHSDGLDRPRISPKWAYEPWVWEDMQNTQTSTLSLVNGYLDRGIPVGGTIVDSPWSTGYNNFEWDTTRYPHAQEMIHELHKKGVNVVMWMTGNINRTSFDAPLSKSTNYDKAVKNGYGLIKPKEYTWWKGTGIHVDVTNPEAKKWFSSELDKIMDMGVDGFKCDEGVGHLPEEITTYQGKLSFQQYKPMWYQFMADYVTKKKSSAIITARPFSYQHGPFHADVKDCIIGWCGDYNGDWDGLTFQMMNLYLSAKAGYSCLQVEVGGYWSKTSNKLQLIRYAQFGSLMPSMCNGGMNEGLKNHLPWWHDEQQGGTETTDIYRYYATLHSELVPFLFSLGVEAHLTGKPIVRNTDLVMGQHTLGEDILVGVINNEYLKTMNIPDGEWIDYWNRNKVIDGNQTLTISPSISQYPIYFRNGSIIPLNVKNAITGNGDENSKGKTTLLIFPDGMSKKTFYKPNGEGIDYTPVKIEVNQSNGLIKINSEQSQEWILRVSANEAPKAVIGSDSWSYDQLNHVIIIHKTGSDIQISVKGPIGIKNQ